MIYLLEGHDVGHGRLNDLVALQDLGYRLVVRDAAATAADRRSRR